MIRRGFFQVLAAVGLGSALPDVKVEAPNYELDIDYDEEPTWSKSTMTFNVDTDKEPLVGLIRRRRREAMNDMRCSLESHCSGHSPCFGGTKNA